MNESLFRSDEQRLAATLLGAAYGDALGWPQEARATAAGDGRSRLGLHLKAWVKRSGGRFQPHREHIGVGEYSDDTQLIMAVARAKINYKEWWEYLARVELPFWLIYQRGGGGASLRAARLWAKSTAPWEATKQDRAKYFVAGGNGVAMRVAPHVLSARTDDEFELIARSVIADGVITHGSPVALVGALAYAYALWRALRTRGTLEYGQLIDELMRDIGVWSVFPYIGEFWPTWERSASESGDYWQQWDSAVDQTAEKLRIASDGLSAGALDFDDETLRKIGCFDKHILGAGTVASAAAVFLASKYAVAPAEGVARAAFSKGADTDTIASMTGALAGAINGVDWLEHNASSVQDYGYIVDLARALGRGAAPERLLFNSLAPKDLTRLLNELSSGATEVTLPIATKARVLGDGGIVADSTKLVVRSWRLVDDNGQTFFLKKIAKSEANKGGADKEIDSLGGQSGSGERHWSARLAGVTLSTHNIDVTRTFYQKILGIELTRDTGKMIQLGGSIVLRQYDVPRQVGGGSVIYVDVKDIEACWKMVSRHIGSSLPLIERNKGRASFVCYDPDGRQVEVFER